MGDSPHLQCENIIAIYFHVVQARPELSVKVCIVGRKPLVDQTEGGHDWRQSGAQVMLHSMFAPNDWVSGRSTQERGFKPERYPMIS